MSVAAPPLQLDNVFARELEGLSLPWTAAPAPAPRLLVLNAALATELGVDPEALRTPEGVALLTGAAVPDGATPVAQAYAGHQFGGWAPRLGDGRALLLGEVTDTAGRLRDVHLKGSGRTPFARGGDGKAAVGPMLREHLTSEAMHALGIPTTRALAVVATGEQVARETLLPGAVLVRVAASHLRVGSFQYAAAQGDRALLRRLADHAIDRHHPGVRTAADPYLALLEAVVEVQAALVARWMLVGFVHGVMNTDNMTISGETIDYGPCAFLDAFDPAAVFSSIDAGGRYAYGNQPHLAQWDLTRLAEALLPLVDAEQDAAVAAVTEVLQTFLGRFNGHWRRGMATKLGLAGEREEDAALMNDLLSVMTKARADHTATWRALSAHLRGDPAPARGRFGDDPAPFDAWAARWHARLADQDAEGTAAGMDAVNPVYVPRNHRVEAALVAATAGDLAPYEHLLEAVTHPFAPSPGHEADAEPAPPELPPHRTFCGT